VIRVDLSDFKRLTRDLEAVSKGAFPHASRNALNAIAFEGRRIWQSELGRAFVLRNDWTTRRLLVTKAKGARMQGMRSTLESPDVFLLKQEAGGIENRSVPTGIATTEGRGANPRRRLVSKPNKVSSISLAPRLAKGNRKQRNAIAIRQAQAAGKRFVYLDTARHKGLFRLTGGKRLKSVDMVWDTTSKSHVVHRTPTLQRTINRLEPKCPALMTSALVEQLKRHKAFGY
jgi:hypothetical protein